MAKTDLAIKPENELVDVEAYEQYGSAGFGNTTSEDFSMPFLAILQGLSPQCETIDAAKPGKLINSVTSDLYPGDPGVPFIPCNTEHVFVEWKKRKDGGGFVAVHTIEDDIVVNCKEKQEFGEYTTPSGNDLIETFYVYGVMPTETGGEQMVIAFSSTKIKKYKAWLTKARGIQIAVKDAQGRVTKRINPPLFAHRYRLKTTKETNNKGDFYNFEISFDGPNAAACRIAPTTELFESCLAMSLVVDQGKAKVAHKTQANETGGSGWSGDRSSEEVPF